MGLGQARMVIDLMDATRLGSRSSRWWPRRRRRPSQASGSRGAAGTRRSGRRCPAERRGIPLPRRAQQGLARQPGGPRRTRAATPRSPTRRRWSWPASPAKTPNPAGGEIIKDKAGRPIGVFRETASGLDRQGARRLAGGEDAASSEPPMRARRSSSPPRKRSRRASRASRMPARTSRRSTLYKQVGDRGQARRCGCG